MPQKRRSVRLSWAQREALVGQALLPNEDWPVHEILDPFSKEQAKARALLTKEGWLDKYGEWTEHAYQAATAIGAGTRPLGTPLENALATYEHWLDKTFTAENYESLVAKGLLDADWDVTEEGWTQVASLTSGGILRGVIQHWREAVREAEKERDEIAKRWAPLEPYVEKLYDAPAETPQRIQAPIEDASFCYECLKNARLCMVLGVWAGAIQCCSAAVECILASVLASRGDKRPDDALPSMETLVVECGVKVPQIRALTRELVGLIKNFRDNSVRPASASNRSGENQARNVYDLTSRFLDDVSEDWFEASDVSSRSHP